MDLEAHTFAAADLVAGAAALDLVNTVTARDSQPRDWLADYAALLDWARQCGDFDTAGLDALAQMARLHPLKARAALGRLKQLREAVCVLVYALSQQRSFDDAEHAALQALDTARRTAAAAAMLEPRTQGLKLRWTGQRSGLDLISHVIAAEAVELLQQVDVARLRICAGGDCGWVFLDSSKSGQRRWCDMATCGNSAKARRFQQAHRTPKAGRRRS